ncbi:MAG: hypothetical protein LBJ13_01335 [Puniceicoccales bacterium]|jgi:ribosome-associated translation inhibitor RaiA|nr:hypothetical protein [Puniceicoccales bacterium]
MVKKILLGLLVSVGGVSNCMATVSTECKDFVSQTLEEAESIKAGFLRNAEKKTELTTLINRVANRMNKKPRKMKRMKKQKDEDSADHKKLEDAYNRIHKMVKEVPD